VISETQENGDSGKEDSGRESVGTIKRNLVSIPPESTGLQLFFHAFGDF